MTWLTPLEDPRARPVRSWVFDIGVVVVAGVFAITPLLVHPEPFGPWLACVAVACLILPLLGRRVWPVPTYMLVVAAAIGFGIADSRLAGNLALPVALYTVAALGTRRQTYGASIVLEVLAVVGAALFGTSGLLVVVVFVLFTGMVVAAVGTGLYVSTHRAYIRELVDRAVRLEFERDQANQLAAAEERARIAREMHDIVAHHLTVMVALSDAAARMAEFDPGRAGEAMRTVSATGRDALGDTRWLLGVLNSDPAGDQSGERHPLPGLGDLDTLIDQVRATGLPVEYRIEGVPIPMARDTQLAVYRLVQESLTNTLKHAPAGSHAQVALAFRPDRLDLSVGDDGAGQPVPPGWQPGRGTTGMTARVQAVGGQLNSGPRNPTGWQVTAHLPLRLPDSGWPNGRQKTGEGP